MALASFADSNLGKKYLAAVASWENAWDMFTPVLAFGGGVPQDHLRHPQHRYFEPARGVSLM